MPPVFENVKNDILPSKRRTPGNHQFPCRGTVICGRPSDACFVSLPSRVVSQAVDEISLERLEEAPTFISAPALISAISYASPFFVRSPLPHKLVCPHRINGKPLLYAVKHVCLIQIKGNASKHVRISGIQLDSPQRPPTRGPGRKGHTLARACGDFSVPRRRGEFPACCDPVCPASSERRIGRDFDSEEPDSLP